MLAITNFLGNVKKWKKVRNGKYGNGSTDKKEKENMSYLYKLYFFLGT